MTKQSQIRLVEKAIALLKQLIAQPSFSKEEDDTAALLVAFLEREKITANRLLNNVWAINKYFDPAKPTLLLNSHHDTVKPNPGYTRDPFEPSEISGKLFGLGSNDAGGCLVSLMATFLYFYDFRDLKFNIVMAATAEEEISGKGGIEALLQHKEFTESLKGSEIFGAIVGEPTLLEMAVAERGLLVLDAFAKGRPGHAARSEGDNALYKAMKDIDWIRHYEFEKTSELLGPVKMTVTVIETENKAHNVVPATCHFVVDIRINERYDFDEVLAIIKEHTQSDFQPRSFRLRSSAIALEHPLVQSGLKMKLNYYGSPTTSDKALMNFPTLKIGPGDSARSHSADEFIYVDEIKKGIETYIQLLQGTSELL